MKNLLKKIINVTEKDNLHIKITILNTIHFSLLKEEYKKRKKDERKTFEYYKKHNIDITTYPKATNVLRDVQLASLELLKELDYVSRKNNFDYWIDFGTLIGAVRHNGFIPWDDDIDVSMPREFYNQFVEVFNRDTRNKNMKALIFRKENKIDNYIIRIKYEEDIFLLLDIFPCDFYGKTLTPKERISKTKELKKNRNKVIRKDTHKKGLSDKEIAQRLKYFRTNLLEHGEFTKESKTDIVWGVDFNHMWKQWFHSYNNIYPLKEIEFEGIKLLCPNNYDEYLKSIYGDYMSYPKNAMHCHSKFRITKKDIEKIKGYYE